MENSNRDDNYVEVVMAVSSADDTEAISIKIDPTTGAVLCEKVAP